MAWSIETLKEHYDELRANDAERRREDRQMILAVLMVLTAEMLRRLRALNHAHERAVEVQHTYVTQEKFDDRVEAVDERAALVAKAVTLAEGKGIGAAQLWAIAATVLLIIVAALAAILH
jgi:hypothetical protein